LKALILILIMMFSYVSFCQAGKDSVAVSYFDYSTYKVFNTGLFFDNTDSLTSFHLSGKNSRTIYEKYSKNDFGFTADLSIVKDSYKFGGILESDYISNSSLNRPTTNNFKLMPLLGYSINNVNIETAYGFVSKSDEISDLKGEGLLIKGNYALKDNLNNFTLNSDLTADNLNDDYNYGNISKLDYVRMFEGDFGNLLLTGNNSIHQYHFSDFSDNLFKIKRYEYNLRTEFLYIASDEIKNISSLGFYARNKDSYKNNSLLAYNSNSDLSLSDEIIYSSSKLFSSLKIDFDTGSDKYSLDYDENDKSLSFYNFALSSYSNYNFSGYIFGISGKYFKHEYKSLTNTNTEDRDIVKFSLKPDMNFTLWNSLSVSQSFPLEYYRLINISSERSGSNYIDRVANSVTDLKNNFNDRFYMTAKIQFRSYYRSYDYDETFSNSFVIKNYSLGDTAAYKINKILTVKLSDQFIYEEFGNFNYDDFTENPVNFKNHYYTSISFLVGRIKNFAFNFEYYFYEIDHYNFDQENFNKSDLTRVYIAHGPKFGANYNYKKFYLSSGIDIDNYRNSPQLVKFKIESGIRFY